MMRRKFLIRAVLAVLAIAMVIAPQLIAVHFIDQRNARRAAAAAVASASAATIRHQKHHIEELTQTTEKVCGALNVDAERINRIIDYVEARSKIVNPGPSTDRFFAGLPRPATTRCTPKRSTP